LLALAGCTQPEATADKKHPDPSTLSSYFAAGNNPDWRLRINYEKVVLTLKPNIVVEYPPAKASERNGILRYEAGDGTRIISVEVKAELCSLEPNGPTLSNKVTVYLSGRMLEGCGSPQIEGWD